MWIELVDQLRCVNAHEDSWLVATFDRMDGRSVVDGRLGCPVCGAEYPIVDGEARFGAPAGTVAAEARGAGGEVRPDDEEAMRLAALLGLDAGAGTVLLAGAWGALAASLVGMVQVRALLVDPPPGVVAGEGTGVVRTDGRLPVAAGSVRGVALDARTAPLLPAAVTALGPRGRIVAPAGLPVPAGVTELARDDRHWVAERSAAPSSFVPLRLARNN